MTPSQVKERRLELGLTADELAFALNMTEAEILAIEAGLSDCCATRAFVAAFDEFEERVFGTFVGA